MEKGGESHRNYEFSGTRLVMSIVPDTPQPFGQRLIAALLPQSCALCGADAEELLCPGCRADLPVLGPACPQCGEPTTHGESCGRCLQRPPHFDAAHATFRYEFPLDRLVQALKYGHQLALAAWFGKTLAGLVADSAFDAVVPLPLHPERLRRRGFNQAAEIGRALAAAGGYRLSLALLARTKATASQTHLPLDERAVNVRNAFECREDLTGRRFLLVDDVMTSGATLDEAARTLKLHGALRVEAAVVARAWRPPLRL